MPLSIHLTIASIFEVIPNFINKFVTFTDCSCEPAQRNSVILYSDEGRYNDTSFADQKAIEPIPPQHAKSTLIAKPIVYLCKSSPRKLILKYDEEDARINGPQF